MPQLNLVAAFFTLALGSLVFWANPRRDLNRIFALFSFVVAAWVVCVFFAIWTGLRFQSDASLDPVPWLRANAAVAAFLPWLIWLLKESVVRPDIPGREAVRRSWPWLATCVALAVLCYTDSFILSESKVGSPKRGWAYTVYVLSNLALCTSLLVQTYRQMRAQTGIRKVELQFLTFNASLACALAIAFNALGRVLQLDALPRLSPLVILSFYALTAWAITFHRVFDARQVFLGAAQRFFAVAALSLGVIGGRAVLEIWFPPTGALVLAVVLTALGVFRFERWTRRQLGLDPDQHVAVLREKVTEIARREPSPEQLILALEEFLRKWGQTAYVRLLFDSGEVHVGADLEFPKERPGHAALRRDGWPTPESLIRRRPAPELDDLRAYLEAHQLGLMLAAPRGAAQPSLIVAFGIKTNLRPFTYPEVEIGREAVEFIDNILARSRLSLQARQSEQLAAAGLIGASLAHEIRNPLVSLKTFAHLLPHRFDDPEFRRRFQVLIPTEVDRIDRLSQQLLDLSHPRRHEMARLPLHLLIKESVDLMHTRAADAKVTLLPRLEAQADTIWADDHAIRQVLINLLINAFQALAQIEGERLVGLRTRNTVDRQIILEISDNGPGIPKEQRARLFHPFVSSKSKGMGLGLAVCADILHEHRATITVAETSGQDQRFRTTFQVTFPCPPPSS